MTGPISECTAFDKRQALGGRYWASLLVADVVAVVVAAAVAANC
jgi:hypothetical protein